MKILIVTQAVDSNDPILGFFHEWIVAFAKQYQTVVVIALGVGTYSLPKNVKIYSLGKEIGSSRWGRLVCFYSYIFRLRKEYDTVFVHMNPEYIVLAGIFWRLFQKKMILWYVHKQVTISLRVALFLTHIVCTSSKESFRLHSQKVHILGHGINTKLLQPLSINVLPPSPFHMISINRISPIKNYDTLIDALSLMRSLGCLWKLSIIGAPGTHEQEVYLEQLRKKVINLGLSKQISFLGPISHKDIGVSLASAHLAINLSDTGSTDKSVLEAMAVGVPVLTSNEAFRELFELNAVPECFVARDPHVVYERILFFFHLSEEKRTVLQRKLREIVVSGYDLESLIKNIASLSVKK